MLGRELNVLLLVEIKLDSSRSSNEMSKILVSFTSFEKNADLCERLDGGEEYLTRLSPHERHVYLAKDTSTMSAYQHARTCYLWQPRHIVLVVNRAHQMAEERAIENSSCLFSRWCDLSFLPSQSMIT
jgi:hypothetical protein